MTGLLKPDLDQKFINVESTFGTAVDPSEVTGIQPVQTTDAVIDRDKVIAGLLALELWQEWFRETDDNPYYDFRYSDYCFFCDNKITNGHTGECLYLRAKALIESV